MGGWRGRRRRAISVDTEYTFSLMSQRVNEYMNNEEVPPNEVDNEFPIIGIMRTVARQPLNLHIVEDTPDLKGRSNGRYSINILHA